MVLGTMLLQCQRTILCQNDDPAKAGSTSIARCHSRGDHDSRIAPVSADPAPSDAHSLPGWLAQPAMTGLGRPT